VARLLIQVMVDAFKIEKKVISTREIKLLKNHTNASLELIKVTRSINI